MDANNQFIGYKRSVRREMEKILNFCSLPND